MAKTAKIYKSYTIRHKVSEHERIVTPDQYEDLRRTSQNWQIVERHEDDLTVKTEKSDRPVVSGNTAAAGKAAAKGEKTESAE